MESVPTPEEGRVILVNKPLHWTSFDVVNKLRYKLKTKKIGHAGTLDPLATGLLIICTGKYTKKIEEYQGQEKEYTGEFVIGQTTPSHDLETTVSSAVDVSHITEENIFTAAKKLTGSLQQVPPLHSAIKINGKRAYKFARKGKSVELKAREVMVARFEVSQINVNTITFRIVCSKGTYIRSLARDFGNELGVGAYLRSLCRTRIGSFELTNAKTLEEIE
ncbi:MAG: tRNA pseudouridine(55) synthase TruB [Flammeovirgaceae bacterium]